MPKKLTVGETGAVIRKYLEGSRDTALVRKPVKEMSGDELLILCQHLSKGLVAETFGGSLQVIQARVKAELEKVRDDIADGAPDAASAP